MEYGILTGLLCLLSYLVGYKTGTKKGVNNDKRGKSKGSRNKALAFCGVPITEFVDAALEIAEWKDQQFSIERKQLIEKANQAVTQSFENGAIFKKKDMIDKACEWLKNNTISVTNDTCTYMASSYDISKKEFIEDFKQAMEE